MTTLRRALPLLLCALAALTARASDRVTEHVATVAKAIAPHVPSAAPVKIVERATASADVRDGKLEVTTGLLAALRSDAQLAMVLAHAESGGVGANPAADDRATTTAMRAVVKAGFDGREALSAWNRLSSATLLGADGGYADDKANARRTRVATRALKSTGQRPSPNAGYAVGEEPYRAEVLQQIEGWKLRASDATPAAPAPTSPPATSSGDEWLVYRRSGGFTGWSLEMRIGAHGSRWIRESQHADQAGARAPLTAEQLATLRKSVDAAVRRPPRTSAPNAKWLRDGLIRSIEVRAESGWTSVSLSEGLELTDADLELVRMLDELAR